MNFPINIEQWRLIDGYDNYEISSHGRVRNNETSKILKIYAEKTGYFSLGLYKDKKKKQHRIHCLVGSAFLEKKEGDIEVDHIDHNRANNMLSNLRWTSKSGNQRNRSNNKNNISGNHGVSYDKRGYWIAFWYNDVKTLKNKSFPVKKYGEEVAKQMAISYRKQMAEANGYLNV